MKRISLFALASLALVASPVAATVEGKDIRDLIIGSKVSDFPQEGYVELFCTAAPKQQLDNWEGYSTCPANAAGQHEVSFQFDKSADALSQANDRSQGTKIGGHPVLISILVSAKQTLDGINIETDPNVRLFLKKKAFLMGLQIRERYGVDGWACVDKPQAEGEEAVGGEFINEHCTKTTPTRRYVYDRVLLQRKGKALKDFVSATRLEISAAP